MNNIFKYMVCICFTTYASCVSAETITKQKEALNAIADFADRFCKEVPLDGSENKTELSGNAKAALSGLSKKLADLGIDGSISYLNQKYKNVPRNQLLMIIQDNNKCRLTIWNDLKQQFIEHKEKTPDMPENLNVSLVDYLAKYNKLASSWVEQEDYVKKSAGKPLVWNGIVTEVTESGLSIRPTKQTSKNDDKITKIFIGVPEVLKPRLHEFLVGKSIRVEGSLAFNSNYPPGYVIAQRIKDTTP